MLKTYSEFISYVNDVGVMAFSGGFLGGFEKLDDVTGPFQWHTGNPETDPWRWKDRAAAEKRLAFGNILGGHKGFISKELYPLFYSACRPDRSLEERYQWGTVPKSVLDVFRLFEDGRALDTGEIRQRMGVRKSEGAGAVDGAVVKLQSAFYITVSGNRRKMSQSGEEYGWPANTYCLADDWAAEWLTEPLLPTDEARARILSHLGAPGRGIDLKKAEKLLFRTVL